eukprot:CAMPEP_0206385008 /NCGR_PEP_ID=MMETSP0294-20121207/14962_1 /ASSEMBLY_ACC=CAM_ASM_000327 /TAXON_ID=39354 /ORGANISM="Heterosigma akashiwo, Strain CCMP2393" /LENGTH=169 /DNA_ID=CAMNT_0053835523 /DNA_START=473 /DNA_END=979 /DNA_ORIENTATION=+
MKVPPEIVAGVGAAVSVINRDEALWPHAQLVQVLDAEVLDDDALVLHVRSPADLFANPIVKSVDRKACPSNKNMIAEGEFIAICIWPNQLHVGPVGAAHVAEEVRPPAAVVLHERVPPAELLVGHADRVVRGPAQRRALAPHAPPLAPQRPGGHLQEQRRLGVVPRAPA